MRDKTLFVVIFACTLAATVSAQQPEAEAVFTSDSKLVELHATVTGPDGTLLTDLPRSAFKVFENDNPQEIKVFRHEDAPVSLGLIIDKSASMTDKHARVAAALLTLVRASNPGDEEFVMEFNETPKMVQDFTQDTDQLADKLRKADASGARRPPPMLREDRQSPRPRRRRRVPAPSGGRFARRGPGV